MFLGQYRDCMDKGLCTFVTEMRTIAPFGFRRGLSRHFLRISRTCSEKRPKASENVRKRPKSISALRATLNCSFNFARPYGAETLTTGRSRAPRRFVRCMWGAHTAPKLEKSNILRKQVERKRDRYFNFAHACRIPFKKSRNTKRQDSLMREFGVFHISKQKLCFIMKDMKLCS